mgnify:CR=1 FL=1
MSENQQPLDEEQAVSDVQEQETLPAAAEDTLPAAQAKMRLPSLTQNPKRKKKILILPM